MLLAAAILFVLAFLLSLAGTALARRIATRLGLIDAPGHRKVHTTPTPRNGGIGIFWGFALPLLFATAGVFILSSLAAHGEPHRYAESGNAHLHDTYLIILGTHVPVDILLHLPGMRAHAPLLLLFLAATFAMHLLGLVDDRKPLAPWPKLIAQLAIAAALVLLGELFGPGSFRILTSAGFFPSTLLSILWILALTNAFNFLDNMDGLSAGVAFICAAMFLIAAAINGQ